MIEKLRIPLSRFLAIAMILFILCSHSKWEGSFVAVLLFTVGCFLVVIASLGRLWSGLYIAGYKTKVLIMEGPYSMCRNPLYFFSLLGAIGVGLATETFFIPFIIFSAFAIYYPYTMRSEEADLLQRHGNAYKTYLDVTPAFFPKSSLLQEPETYMVNTRIFRKHILDAVWFMWLFGIIKIIGTFHDMGLLPAIFNLY
jgi:protein-S-isoprenylcysteine O-methyltransferase Ste14